MDEYDVFMDEILRRNTLNYLKEYVLLTLQRSSQFIVLTPHNVGDLQVSESLRVRKMADPERRSAHGLQQQTIN